MEKISPNPEPQILEALPQHEITEKTRMINIGNRIVNMSCIGNTGSQKRLVIRLVIEKVMGWKICIKKIIYKKM